MSTAWVRDRNLSGLLKNTFKLERRKSQENNSKREKFNKQSSTNEGLKRDSREIQVIGKEIHERGGKRELFIQ